MGFRTPRRQQTRNKINNSRIQNSAQNAWPFAHTGAGAPATPLHFALPQLASAIAQFDAPAVLPALHHPYQSPRSPILA